MGKTSLYIFKGDSFIRKSCVWLIDWIYFKNFILLIIFMNSVTLAIYDYTDRDSLTIKNQIIDIASSIFTYIYVLEAIIEIIARGLI